MGKVLAIGNSYAKEIVEIKTDYGIFSCTPNHPFFTNKGWVRACNLSQSHYIIGTYEAMRIVRAKLPAEKKVQIENAEILREILLGEI